jgi:tetratricopeptide (TPR) repeat protein
MTKIIISAILLLLVFDPASIKASDKSSYLHFMNGLVLERKGNYDSALQEYKATMLLDPQSVFVYKHALNLALHIGKVSEAEEWAKYVVAADSGSAENWVLYGNVHWAKGDLEGARSAFEKAAELDKESPEAVYQLASLWSAKSPDKSAEYLKKYLALKPEEAPEVYYQLALLYNIKNDYETMKKYLFKAKAADAMYVQPRYMLANYYEVKNDTASAINEYVELLLLEGGHTELLNHIGELYAAPAVSNLAAAEQYFLKSYALDKTNAVACFWLSVISEQRRDFAAACGYLEASKDLKENPGTVLRLSYYYTQNGGYDKAISLLEDAHKKWPDNLEISYFLALGYDDTRRTSGALQLLKGILAVKPDYVEARLQYAVISEREGDMVAAEENFRYLLAKDPGNANILNYLGYALADRGLKLDEAQELIGKAVKADPSNGAYADSLAWVHFKQGKYPAALDEIKRALKLIYDDAILWDHAGDIYAAGLDWPAAWRAYSISGALARTGKEKEVRAKIKSIRRQIPDPEASALTGEFLRSLALNGKDFSAFVKVYVSFKGKKIKLDGVLRFLAPDNFTFTLMGPLMVPMWKIKIEGNEVSMDAASLKGIDEGTFNYWAALMGTELKDYLSGGFLSGAGLENGWGSDAMLSPSRKIYLNEGGYVAKSAPLKEKKFEIRFSDYFMRNMCLIPQTIEFKIPFFSLKMVLDKSQINLKGFNALKP